MKLCLLLLLLLWSWSSESEEAAPRLSCRDENNGDVMWYILYKSPGGQRYMHISSKGIEKTNKNIGDPHGVLANTLSPMFDDTMAESFGFLSYNDQPPKKNYDTSDNDTSDSAPDLPLTASDTFGHSKGVVLGDSGTKTALWLTHSTPNFPTNRKLNSFWPKTGERNGQTFMCVTLAYDDLRDIGNHLQYIHAKTFDSVIPLNFPQEIKDAAKNVDRTPQGNPTMISLKVGNKEFRAVAKVTGNSAADGDLYVQLSRIFNSPIDVKPWGCQSKADQSYCVPNQHQVMNVIEVRTDLEVWKWTVDHSKWAVTSDQNIQWTCIADMNRAESQYKRPGGALCIQDQKVSDLFRGFVKERLPCGVSPKACKMNEEESPTGSVEKMDLNKYVIILLTCYYIVSVTCYYYATV